MKWIMNFVNLGCFDGKILKFQFVVNTNWLLSKLGQVKGYKIKIWKGNKVS